MGIVKTNSDAVAAAQQGREETRAPEKFLRPPVRIIESTEELVLTADIPGAVKEELDINVEKGLLTINAPAKAEVPGKMIYAEFELAPYYRQFSIPETLDQEKAAATLINGVLTLSIPKAAVAKPRKIEIRSA